jgi:hypothetical protein
MWCTEDLHLNLHIAAFLSITPNLSRWTFLRCCCWNMGQVRWVCDYEEYCLLGCNATQSNERSVAFTRNILSRPKGTGFVLVTGLIRLRQFLITIHYDAVANSHTRQFTTARSESSQSAALSPNLWYRLPTADVPLPAFPNSSRATAIITSQYTY